MEVTYPIGIVESVFLSCNAYKDMDYSLSMSTTALEHGYLGVGKWFGIDVFQSLDYFENVSKVDYVTESFTERVSWLFRRFYLNSLYCDF